MNKQNVVLISSAVLIIAIIGGGIFVAMDRFGSQDSAISKPAVDLPLESAITKPGSSSDLSVKSIQTNQQPQEIQNNLPTPDQFSIYEEYANTDGVQYIDSQVGDGQLAEKGDTVAVVYAGWLTDGSMFDRSPVNESGRVEAFGFTIGAGNVIQGWDIGIAGMKEGGVRRLIIPSQLAYGDTGAADGVIPPNAMLIFDVELAQVQKPTSSP